MVQYLDENSLSLIMNDASDDGREAIRILCQHYKGTGRPRILTLYSQLGNLTLNMDKTITDHIIQSEKLAVSLKSAGESVSDSLLVAMVLKGFPDHFSPFTVYITQSERDYMFSEFKVALRNFGENEGLKSDSGLGAHGSDFAMAAVPSTSTGHHQNSQKEMVCFRCNKPGKFARE